MKKILLSLLITGGISGCSSFSFYQDEEKEQAVEVRNPLMPQAGLAVHSSADSKWVKQGKTNPKLKNINNYASGIMQDLLSNLQYVGPSTPVAVADFVMLDSDFNSSNLIGQQLSQAFIHEVHKLGVPVVDYKLTDYIRVSPQGDLALTKDFLELNADLPIKYILTGTLLDDGDNTIVNARIVGVESKAVVASAQGVLPAAVTKNIHVMNGNDGITQ